MSRALIDDDPVYTRAATPDEITAYAGPRGGRSYDRRPLDLAALGHTPPPPRDWAIDHWLGMGHVTLLAGRGGIGKSLLAQQMATTLAIGRDMIDRVATPRTVLYWAAEDEPDELARRQISICRALDVEPAELVGRLVIESYHDRDCTLVASTYGESAQTGMVDELRAQINDYAADVVILDNIARLFAGNENARHDVTTFIAALASASAGRRVANMLLGHVGKALGSEFSGSTAWENAVRSRLWFSDKRPDEVPGDDDDEPDSAVRYLARRKANYGAADLRSMRYDNGAFSVDPFEVPGQRGVGMVESIRRRNAERVVLDGLTAAEALNYPPSDNHGRNYLPAILAKHGLAEGHSKADLERAMHRLIGDGRILRKSEKSANRSSDRIRLVRGQE